jgi:hypothetical protein
VVGIGAVFPALCGSQLNLGHGRIIAAGCGAVSNGIEIVEDNGAMKVKTQSKKVNKAWLNDHVNDTYVKLAQKEGYRARAAYKLKEIDEQLGLIKPGHTVVDLGSTPGAWSQYVRRRLSPAGAAAGQLNGCIIALDILPMEPVEGVTFLQGDFREPRCCSSWSRRWQGAGGCGGVRHGAQPVRHRVGRRGAHCASGGAGRGLCLPT